MTTQSSKKNNNKNENKKMNNNKWLEQIQPPIWVMAGTNPTTNSAYGIDKCFVSIEIIVLFSMEIIVNHARPHSLVYSYIVYLKVSICTIVIEITI
jgi:1-deoxy-D-xylulose 5-phosphate reductoisomerase